MADRPPYFARGFTHPFGKLAQNLGQLRLPGETDELVRIAAARVGKTPIEFVREMVVMSIHGRSEIERRYSINLDAIQQVLPKRNVSK